MMKGYTYSVLVDNKAKAERSELHELSLYHRVGCSRVNFPHLVVKSKLPPRSGSSLEAVEPHP